MNNIGRVTAEELAEKEATLQRHCEATGRDEKSIERTIGAGVTFIRDSREEAFTVMADVFADNGDAKTWTNMPVGAVEHVVEHCKPYLDQGYRHLIFGFPAPYDEETLERLATEVRPQLEAYLAR
jgi:alkanesulfonate monooxygenase SsuD/methylene tetrahydromethanopterin reductase-like flavin-dependent oxidoreductase (luciferase family)